jgi:hypothetical protein
MRKSRQLKSCLGIAVVAMCAMILSLSRAVTVEDPSYKTAGGLAVYVGVVPAEIVKGHPSDHAEGMMHGRAPPGRHQYHLVAALFDMATGARVLRASVTAQVSGLGLAGPTFNLEPMEIAGTTTFGGFVRLPGSDLYTIRLTIQRNGEPRPVVLDFKYDHRRTARP